MSPTTEQIITEARRRAKEQNWRMDIEDYIIEVMREGWTPHEPVNPDLLAFREWVAKGWPGGERRALSGEVDNCDEATAYLAGARMAREQERERAGPLVEYVDYHAVHIALPSARAILAKYRGEA